eukprot:763352-Hanusia_phi.AAC.3
MGQSEEKVRTAGVEGTRSRCLRRRAGVRRDCLQRRRLVPGLRKVLLPAPPPQPVNIARSGSFIDGGRSWCDPFKSWEVIYSNDPCEVCS